MGLTVKKFRKLPDGTLEVREDVKIVVGISEEIRLEDDSKDTKEKGKRVRKTKKKDDHPT
tara:strand:- start:2876 stop:3055 length:180 start_codon:yes stop_codon:yes gene_type:complete